MAIVEIKTKKDYEKALKRLEVIWGAKEGTTEDEELDLLADLIDKYEEEHFPIEELKE
jgi:HTH-type transcriptional regulator/antitoxin HigA